MLTQELAIEKVRSFAREIMANGIKLNKVILFGSYSVNQQREYSDIDVVLVSDIFTGMGFEDRKHFSKINIKKNYIEIETKTYPTKYFKKETPSLKRF